MIWLFVVIGAVLVAAIAVTALGVAVGRLETEATPALYEVEDAVDFIAERLPDEITARLGYDDVRTVVRWHLDWFATVGLATPHGEEIGDAAVAIDGSAVADEQAGIDAVVARSLAEGGPEPVDVVCILDLQMRYLDEIGALGPTDGPDDPFD